MPPTEKRSPRPRWAACQAVPTPVTVAEPAVTVTVPTFWYGASGPMERYMVLGLTANGKLGSAKGSTAWVLLAPSFVPRSDEIGVAVS